MRVISLFVAFIFLGIAAAVPIPEATALDETVSGSNDKQGGPLDLPTLTSFDLPIPQATPLDFANHEHAGSSSDGARHHTKSTKKGKHPHPSTSRGAKPTSIGSPAPPLHTTSANDPHAHHGDHRSSKSGVHGHHSYSASGQSDNPKYTGKPSRRPTQKTHGFDPTGTISTVKPTGEVA